MTFDTTSRWLLAGLFTACTWPSVWAGRPLSIDDAGVNETGHGHVELWQSRKSDGTHSLTVAPAFAPVPNLEIGLAHELSAQDNASATSIAVKYLFSDSLTQGCNQGLGLGLTRRNLGEAGSRNSWLLNTCNTAWGSWHTNLGFTQTHGASSQPLLGMALEWSMPSWTPHLEWLSTATALPTWGVGVKRALGRHWQLDGSVLRQGPLNTFTLGAKISF